MNKKNILKNLDYLFSFNPFLVFNNLIYLMVFGILFSLIFIGIRLQLLEGYFQYMVFTVMVVFCVREAGRYFSKLLGLWVVVGTGVLLHFVLLMVGYYQPILEAMAKFVVIIVITSLIYYHLGFRKYLIKKFRLTKQEVLELKQNQK